MSEEIKKEAIVEEKQEDKSIPAKTNSDKLAVVLVRGYVNLSKPIKDTLTMLNLRRKNHCVVIKKNSVNEGMLKKIKDHITWGEISDQTYKELIEKRGVGFKGRIKDSKEKYSYNKYLEFDGKKYKKYFKLNPPRKGFGRKGIKLSFNVGGGLGYRGEKMNDLIRRML